MDRIDQLIEEALSEEDRVIREATAERGWFALGIAQFRGKLGWGTWVIMAVQTTMFVAAVWAGWRFYAATEVLAAVKWGLSAAVLAILALQMKLSLMPQIQADRILRQMRRLELMLARREGGE